MKKKKERKKEEKLPILLGRLIIISTSSSATRRPNTPSKPRTAYPKSSSACRIDSLSQQKHLVPPLLESCNLIVHNRFHPIPHTLRLGLPSQFPQPLSSAACIATPQNERKRMQLLCILDGDLINLGALDGAFLVENLGQGWGGGIPGL